MTSLKDIVPPGCITGDDVTNLFEHARANGYAIPAFNCTRYDIDVFASVDGLNACPAIHLIYLVSRKIFLFQK